MECACISIEYSTNEFYSIKEHKAHKKHKCDECGRSIEPGEIYQYEAGKSEGEFFQHKVCVDCHSIRKAFFCAGWVFGTVLLDLREFIFDSAGDISEKALSMLTPNALDTIQNMLNDYNDSKNYDW